jgi:hypothetical protein
LPAPVVAALTGSRGSKTLGTGVAARDETLRLELLGQLAQHRGNLEAVARAMRKAPMQVYRWCKRFGVDPNVYRG